MCLQSHRHPTDVEYLNSIHSTRRTEKLPQLLLTRFEFDHCVLIADEDVGQILNEGPIDNSVVIILQRPHRRLRTTLDQLRDEDVDASTSDIEGGENGTTNGRTHRSEGGRTRRGGG